jgi:hypothetical protein
MFCELLALYLTCSLRSLRIAPGGRLLRRRAPTKSVSAPSSSARRRAIRLATSLGETYISVGFCGLHRLHNPCRPSASDVNVGFAISAAGSSRFPNESGITPAA